MSEWSSPFSLLCVTPLKVQISEQEPHWLSLDCGLPLTVPDRGRKDVSEGRQGPFQVPYLEGRMPVLSSRRLSTVQESFPPKRKFRGIRKVDWMTGDQKMTNFFFSWKLLTQFKNKTPKQPGKLIKFVCLVLPDFLYDCKRLREIYLCVLFAFPDSLLSLRAGIHQL